MRFVRHGLLILFVSVFLGAFHLFPAESYGAEGVELGQLICKSKPGSREQLFFSSSVAIKCTFTTLAGKENYKGEIGLLGVDLSQKSEQTLYFTVFGFGTNIKMGAHGLAGEYVGTSISASLIKEGLGSSQFVGGVRESLSLVPSLDTFKGVGISIGVSRMKLEAGK